MKKKVLGIVLASLAFILATDVAPAWAQTLVWIRQFGTYSWDEAWGVAVYGSSVYVAGHTHAALPGQTSKGGEDAFVRKYDAYGNLKWTRQFGTSNWDNAEGVAVYGSEVYVVGSTLGALPGQTNKGSFDAFVRKYDAYGNLKWTRQFGSSMADFAREISVDYSGIYVSGETLGALPGQTNKGGWDAFVCKYDVYGNLKWIRQFGTSGTDGAFGVAVYNSRVYVVGRGYLAPSPLPPGGWYIIAPFFVRKYDAYGNHLWTSIFGSPFGSGAAMGVAVYGSSVYVAGYQALALPGQTPGPYDGFVYKYDTSGKVKWAKYIETSGDDDAFAYGIAVSSSGYAYVVGGTLGALPGQTNKGSFDAFVRKYDAYGNLKWTRQFGSSNSDDARRVSVSSSGVYIDGYTWGALPGQTNKGTMDAYVCKIAPP